MSEPAALERLRALLHEDGGLIASLLHRGRAQDGAGATATAAAAGGGDGDGAAGSPASPASAAAAGPRARARRGEYELLVEAIYEGYLLHYGVPRVVRTREADLRVLAGDRLYAIGLARLVELGDTAAVAELADTITLSALAQGAGDGPLAEAVWAAGARAVGWGASEQHRRAKRLVADRSPYAIEAMRTSALPAPSTP
ncbi:MAG: hypothetical protein QOF54_203 [Solirubrobacteraceae bacterium]|nr:hypothetical protein [Solirubrobacteraceae bacterium]